MRVAAHPVDHRNARGGIRMWTPVRPVGVVRGDA